QLFANGKQLLETRHYDEAAAALAESDRLDPAIGTIGLLARCHELQGRLTVARREYEETARRAAAKGDSREAFARERAAELVKRLGHLRLGLPPGAVGARLLLDGQAVEPDRDLDLDPGPHVVDAEQGASRSRVSLRLGDGETKALVVELPVAPPLA